MNTKKIVALSLIVLFAAGASFAQEPQGKKPPKAEAKKGSTIKKGGFAKKAQENKTKKP